MKNVKFMLPQKMLSLLKNVKFMLPQKNAVTAEVQVLLDTENLLQ